MLNLSKNELARSILAVGTEWHFRWRLILPLQGAASWFLGLLKARRSVKRQTAASGLHIGFIGSQFRHIGKPVGELKETGVKTVQSA